MRPVNFGQMWYWPNSVWPNAVATVSFFWGGVWGRGGRVFFFFGREGGERREGGRFFFLGGGRGVVFFCVFFLGGVR